MMEALHQVRLECHVLWRKGGGKVWHDFGLDWARCNTIDSDIAVKE
jgi:hypothetical protein